MVSIDCLDCSYDCGTPYIFLFRYKMEHKDKVSMCACGYESISGNCVEVNFKVKRDCFKMF